VCHRLAVAIGNSVSGGPNLNRPTRRLKRPSSAVLSPEREPAERVSTARRQQSNTGPILATTEGPSDSSSRRKTLAEELRLQLADEIVRGVLRPGTPLDETELARRFNVSRTPVREAIRLLAANGLVEVREHRAAMVAKPDSQQLVGMFETMAELEALSAGLAAERMTVPQRRKLQEIHERLRALIQTGDPRCYHELNEAFHSTIYDGADNAYLAEMTLLTRARVRPFRWAQFRNLGRLAKSHIEHERVMQAILRGERSVAERAMREHILMVRDEYGAYTESR
jgi:DNA-binding GntR family transcriptional regulator